MLAEGRVGRQAVVCAGLPYLHAIQAGGALEMVLAPRPLDEPEADALMGQAHGLCLLGGGDVDPARYGQPRHPRTYGVDSTQDTFELALLGAAVRLKRPVLAICRGLQLVNVAFGGTLVQHLADGPLDRTGHGDQAAAAGPGGPDLLAHAPAAFPAAEPGSVGPLLAVSVAAGSRLHGLLGAPNEPVVGAHSHHQAVATVGAGLVVVGRSADGVIEALEHGDHWIVAVQWHPEDTAATDPTMQGLFTRFVNHAATPR